MKWVFLIAVLASCGPAEEKYVAVEKEVDAYCACVAEAKNKPVAEFLQARCPEEAFQAAWQVLASAGATDDRAGNLFSTQAKCGRDFSDTKAAMRELAPRR